MAIGPELSAATKNFFDLSEKETEIVWDARSSPSANVESISLYDEERRLFATRVRAGVSNERKSIIFISPATDRREAEP
jgi:hypothetical protein